jgi:2-polyprenyl-3-methyl-5-hydroxy-6-metoxy-1,4-benzoquinol methylase
MNMEEINCPICGSPKKNCLYNFESGLGIASCGECSFVFTSPRLTSDERKKIYESVYFGDEEENLSLNYLKNAPLFRHDAKERCDILGKYLSEGASVLEIGSAAGFFLKECSERGYNSVGLEISAEMCEYAKKELNVNCINADIDNCHLPSERYNAVALWHVLEHMESPLEKLKRLKEIITENGFLFITVPNILSGHAKKNGKLWHHLQPELHLSHFSPASISKILTISGYKIIRVTKTGSTGLLAAKSDGARHLFRGFLSANIAKLEMIRKPVKYFLSNIIGKDDFITVAAKKND